MFSCLSPVRVNTRWPISVEKYHMIGNTRSWLVVQLLALISLIAKIKKTYLQNWVISTQNEYTNYSSHFKYKICLKIFCLIFFWRWTVSFNSVRSPRHVWVAHDRKCIHTQVVILAINGVSTRANTASKRMAFDDVLQQW